MEEIEKLQLILAEFSHFINEPTRSKANYHKDNLANRRFSEVMIDCHYLERIINRLSKDIETVEKNLDVKSVYIFGRIFTESLVYFIEIFFATKNIEWGKIGTFLGTVRENIEEQGEDFKKFWNTIEKNIQRLCDSFAYRNFTIHEKRKKHITEWTIHLAGDGGNNLDDLYIEDVSRDGKSKKTIPIRELIKTTFENVETILLYLKGIV